MFSVYLLASGFLLLCTFCQESQQALELAVYTSFPFGKNWKHLSRQSVHLYNTSYCGFILFQILWSPVAILMYTIHTVLSIFFALSVVGMPFARLHWELRHIALYPFYPTDSYNRVVSEY